MLLYRCIWCNISDVFFRLRNNERCYTDVWGHNISDAGLLVCGTTNVVITGSLYFFCHINFSSVEREPLLYR